MRKVLVTAAAAGVALSTAGAASAGLHRVGERASAASTQPERLNVATIEIEGPIVEQPSPFSWLTGTPDMTMTGYADLFEKAAGDGRIDAVLVRLKDAQLATTQIEELGAMMTELRDAGKHVVVYAEIVGPAEAMLGTYADRTVMQAGGAITLPGLYTEEIYLADAMEWLGVKPQFIQVGDFKGASEQFNAEPSEAWEQNISQLLDSMYDNMRETFLDAGMTEDQLDEALASAWLAGADVGLETGLIDAAVDLPELGEYIAGAFDADDVAWSNRLEQSAGTSPLASANPFAMFSLFTQKPDTTPRRNTIAVVHIEGPIVDGDSTAAGLFGGATTGSRTVRKALEDVRAQDKIGGVIIRINSPGGSAIASEVIWQGLQRVGEVKPVWASVGTMAASGGYYIAVGADRIYTNEASILGSIGVVGGKLATGELMDKLNINTVERTRGPRAGLMSLTRPWSRGEMRLVRERMQDIYDLFVSRVEAGRDGIDISRTAEGRLFTGDKAVKLAMADELGGLDASVTGLADELGWADGSYDVRHYPLPMSLEELLEESLGGFVNAPSLRAGAAEFAGEAAMSGLASELSKTVTSALGARGWEQLRAQLSAMMQLRNEPVLLVSPRALIVP